MDRSDQGSDATDATLTPSQAPTSAGQGTATGEGRATLPPPGYRLGSLLGKGGMGEIVHAEDTRIGRDVAIKRMRADKTSVDAVARFLREARIQARLDHPAIVPVYEMGTDQKQRPYFTMKRLAGATLYQVLEEDRWSQQKLLRAFVDVCLAVDFAHARRVVHRDLKPSNIMLGDYGEVYVLDWGVARVLDDAETIGTEIDSLDGHTQAGAILGTPGYASPEQVRGDEISTATDIYALGSILFDILAGEPAHPSGQAGLASTVQMPTVSPSQRVPVRNIAPELEAACVAALAARAEDRPTARELADRIQAFLDGDRDIARRRKLAAEHLDRARRALDSGDPSRRAEAINAAGRALALDPESQSAALLVSGLMIEAPKQLPERLQEKLERSDRADIQKQARVAALSLGTYCAFLPLVVWVGIRDWTPVLVAFSAGLLMVALSQVIAREPRRISWAVAANFLMLVMLSRVFGPFLVVPGIALAATVGLVSFPTLLDRAWIVIGAMLAAIFTPLVLEGSDVWASTWTLEHGALTSRPTALELSGTPAIVLLCLAHSALIVVMALFVRSLAAQQRKARREIEIQAWHLEQLLPSA